MIDGDEAGDAQGVEAADLDLLEGVALLDPGAVGAGHDLPAVAVDDAVAEAVEQEDAVAGGVGVGIAAVAELVGGGAAALAEVGLIGVGDVRAVVAGVADGVAILVVLVGVLAGRAVVGGIVDAVAVEVVAGRAVGGVDGRELVVGQAGRVEAEDGVAAGRRERERRGGERGGGRSGSRAHGRKGYRRGASGETGMGGSSTSVRTRARTHLP